jgi:streptomycin 6-kinase
VDPALVRQLRAVYGVEIDPWLEALPTTIEVLSSEWGLTDVRPIDSQYIGVSVVLQGKSVSGDVVLKLVPPAGDSQPREVAALQGWNGRGAVRLLEQDVHRGALLLERLAPGDVLAVTDETDDEATRVIADVASRLAVTAIPEVARQLPGLEVWTDDLMSYAQTYGQSGPIDADLIDTARSLIDHLLETAPQPVLLHGDLHHDNVLSTPDGWVAIDPKGYVGDPAAEVGQMFFNPIPYVRPLSDDALQGLVERRLDAWARFSDLDPDRVRRWAFVKAVVSDVWSVEDEGEADGLPARVAHALQDGLGASPR